jgi:molybdopterin-guanine dinucleotide biosynthesis protein
VPVFWVECDEDRALAILIADNRTSDIGQWDELALTDILQDLAKVDMLIETGYDHEDLQKLMMSDEQGEPREKKEVICPKCGTRISGKE